MTTIPWYEKYMMQLLHPTENTNAAKFNLGWTSIAFIRGKG